MERSVTKHYVKIIRVILSCTTQEHVLSTKQLIDNFHNYWGHKGDKYINHLNSLLFIKRIQIYNEE
jgi:hypothetical protein